MNMTSLTQTIASLLEAHPERPVLVALDGRCGSGKTTLAAQLAEPFPGSAVFHTDDYYLPPAQRIPNWAETPCANMDLTRLREEVLVPAQAGAAVRSQAYSCREGAYLPERCVPPAPLYILEGSYSHHPIHLFQRRAGPPFASAGRRTLRKLCPSVDPSGRGLLCAVPHRSAG